MEVKSNIGEVTKDTKKLSNEASNAAGDFKVMGFSLNGVKKGFASAAVTAKGMFGTIKAGLISSGIGIFLIAIGALVQYFKDSEEGASKLKQITSALGVVFGNFTDIISNLGKLLFETFSNPKQAVADLWTAIKTNLVNRMEGLIDSFGALGKVIKGALTLDWDAMKDGGADFGESMVQISTGVDDLFNKVKDGVDSTIDSFKEFGKVTKKEVAQAIQLEKDRLALQIFEREAIVEKARTEKDMMELRLKARDFETFAAEERLGFMREANVLAAEQLEKDLFVAKEKLRFQVEENSYSKSTQQNLDDEAALQAAVFNLEKSNFSERKRLKSEEQAIVKEIAANNKILAKEKLDQIAAELKATEDLYDAQIKQADAYEKRVEKLAKDEIKLANDVRNAKQDSAKSGLKLIQEVAGKGTEIAKAAAIAQATISGVQGVQNAFTTAQKSPITAAFPAYPFIQAGLAGAFSALQIQKILSGSPAGGGGGGGGASAVPSTPAPQMMSGAFDISGGVAPEATKAYVVTDEMSNSQNQLANIRRRATI